MFGGLLPPALVTERGAFVRLTRGEPDELGVISLLAGTLPGGNRQGHPDGR